MISNDRESEIFSKFKDDKNQSYFILIQWDTTNDDKYLELTLNDGTNSWISTSTKAELERKNKTFSLEKIKKELNHVFKYNQSVVNDNYTINVSQEDSFAKLKVSATNG